MLLFHWGENMNNYFEELEPFIDERIQTNYKKLENCKSFKKKYIDFSRNYDYLFNKLHGNDKKTLEKIYGLLNTMHAKENYLTYLVGFVDGIKLNDYLGKN